MTLDQFIDHEAAQVGQVFDIFQDLPPIDPHRFFIDPKQTLLDQDPLPPTQMENPMTLEDYSNDFEGLPEKFTAPFRLKRPGDECFLDEEIENDWSLSSESSDSDDETPTVVGMDLTVGELAPMAAVPVPDPDGATGPDAAPGPGPDPVPVPVPNAFPVPEWNPDPEPVPDQTNLMTPPLKPATSPDLPQIRCKSPRRFQLEDAEQLADRLCDSGALVEEASSSPDFQSRDAMEFVAVAEAVAAPKPRPPARRPDELTLKKRSAAKLYRNNWMKVLADLQRWKMFGPMPYLPTEIREISLDPATGPQEWYLNASRCRAAAVFHGEAVSPLYQQWYDSHLLPGIRAARELASGNPDVRLPGELLAESTMRLVKVEDRLDVVDVPFRVVGSEMTEPMVWLRAPRASIPTGSSHGTIGTSPLETSLIGSLPSTCATNPSEEPKAPPTSRAGSPSDKGAIGLLLSSSEYLETKSTSSSSKVPSSKRTSTAPKRRHDASLTSASIDEDPFPLETRAQAIALLSTLWPMPHSMAGTPDESRFDIRCPGCGITKASILSLAPSQWAAIRRSHPLCGGTGAPLGLERLMQPIRSSAASTEMTASTTRPPAPRNGGMATAQEWVSSGMTFERATAVTLICYTCSIGIPYAWK